jgi:hypothetical protein
MTGKKYFLDPADLQFKQVRLAWRHRISRFTIWFAASVLVSAVYISAFENWFGSPKEELLEQQVEELKLRYSFLQRKIDYSEQVLSYLRQSDEMRYRPLLDMEPVPATLRVPGTGGTDKSREFKTLSNGSLVGETRERVDLLINMSRVQEESFKSVEERKDEWIRENEYLPKISPVDVIYPRGDGLKFRLEHPVLGIARMHNGQDFSCPYGTDVHATGAGRVVTAGWSGNGFGHHVIIDHGYGFTTIYGHLSKIEVTEGMNVKRGDLLGLSGNSGTSSGPHLHYQIDFNGSHKNPLEFFSDDLTPEEYREMILTLSSRSSFR